MTDLKSLGNEAAIPKEPLASILETISIPKETGSEVTLTTQSFTSLCPVTGQPDYGSITIYYRPRCNLIETKSLKLYLQAYRNTAIFVEVAMNQIYEHLFKVIKPHALEVFGEFQPRGGMSMTFKRGSR